MISRIDIVYTNEGSMDVRYYPDVLGKVKEVTPFTFCNDVKVYNKLIDWFRCEFNEVKELPSLKEANSDNNEQRRFL
jgi:hypothetical protein